MNTNFAITGNAEILQIAESVAREKGIQRESVIEALEQAIQIVGRKKYGHEQNIHVEIDRKTGEITLLRLRDVVEVVENTLTQIDLHEAKLRNPDAEIGDVVSDPLPPIDFGRVTAQTAKQVIVQKVRDAERERQFDDFKERAGEIISGTVKRVEYGNVVVDLGKSEALLRREEIIPREVFRQNDRVRAYIMDVRAEKKGPQIFLSRTHPQFMAKLFAQEVPEIYDGVISIVAVARDPGSRAKIAVHSNDSSVDPLSSCIGVRGVRVKAIVEELQGEKIDIVKWSSDPATFVVNALTTADVSKIVLDEEKHRIEVVVPDDQLSLAIGRRGQNVRLASQLIGWNIDVLTEEEESRRRTEEFVQVSKLFIESLNVEEVIAHLLVTEGFRTIEDVAYVPLDDLASIEGFDESVAEELQRRAAEYLAKLESETQDKLKALGVDESLQETLGITSDLLLKLGEAGIKTADDLGDLSRDEFLEMLPESGLKYAEIDQLIMKAREGWFADDQDTNNQGTNG